MKKLMMLSLVFVGFLGMTFQSFAGIQAVPGVRDTNTDSWHICCDGTEGVCAYIWVPVAPPTDGLVSHAGYYLPDLGTGKCDLDMSFTPGPGTHGVTLGLTFTSATFGITSYSQLVAYGSTH